MSSKSGDMGLLVAFLGVGGMGGAASQPRARVIYGTIFCMIYYLLGVHVDVINKT